MKVLDNFYIDGAWVPSSGDSHVDVIDSATEEIIAKVAEGTAADVDAAVAAAKAAFATWSTTPVDIRAKYLRDIGGALAGRFDEIADTISAEVGSPKSFAQMVQAGLSLGEWESFATLVEGYEFEETVGNSLVVREPIGVVGAITPWNYPLYLIICKVVPAIAAGCTVVLKPSEVTPLNAYILAEVIHEVGLPAGVFNMVVGTGPDGRRGHVGASRHRHDLVHRLRPRRVPRCTRTAADTVKRVGLELGGKSANIILDDADPAHGRHGRGVRLRSSTPARPARRSPGCWCPSPARTSSSTRSSPRHRCAGWSTPRPTSPTCSTRSARCRPRPTRSGSATTSARASTRARRWRSAARSSPRSSPRASTSSPTVFTDVTPDMTIAQEEIFGPVLSILTYTDEDDAVEIANGTIYGLAGGVQSADPERAKAIARRMRTGQVDINGAAFNTAAPFGGYKQSGNTRERGRWGLEEFLETKSIQL